MSGRRGAPLGEAAVAAALAPYAGRLWRLVEAQHKVATLALVDSLEEQRLLEEILERSKPPVPPECAHLHYLLATPFRYGRYPSDSRFRRAGASPGVFYASEAALTAAMETVWHRLRFLAAAPGAAFPRRAAEHTAFAVKVATEAVDLIEGPLASARERWAAPEDYRACLDLADAARAAGAGAIRYASVRAPDGGANLAVLTCAAFAAPRPLARQSWRILLKPGGAVILREWPGRAWEVRIEGHRLALV